VRPTEVIVAAVCAELIVPCALKGLVVLGWSTAVVVGVEDVEQADL
jgi:hypothetical protein